MSMTCFDAGWTAVSPARASAAEALSDEALIRRIANGDQLAMRTFFVRHRLAVYRWLFRLTRDATLANELLSDVFFDVWRKAISFEGRSSASTWMLAIARQKALSGRWRGTDTELGDDLPTKVANPSDNQEILLQKKNRKELLRQSLARLSPQHSEIIDLVYYHGKSVKEVAEIVGTNEATVKTRMFYARSELAELISIVA
jgi:RNA polymerase sigma-70 factor (ECF subfamily)